MNQNSSRQLLRVYAICLLGTFAGSFISPILRLLVDLGVDSAVITFYRMLFVSLLLVPLLLSRKESRQNLRSISPKVFAAVSYTHLDVYKRQDVYGPAVQYCGSEPGPLLLCIRLF